MRRNLRVLYLLTFMISMVLFMIFLPLRHHTQNGVVERKNRTLQEMVRVMLNSKKLSTRLWAEVVSIACYIIYKVYLRSGANKPAYEIWKGKKSNLSYFHCLVVLVIF